MPTHASFMAWFGTRMSVRKLGFSLLALVAVAGLPSKARAVTLTPSVASPQKVGTPVTWTAAVQAPVAGHTYDYQFTVTYDGLAQIVRDFAPSKTFTWVPHTVEGEYQVSVVIRDVTTAPYLIYSPASASFTLQPWVTTPLAAGVINPTSHPLVALFSGPPCAAGDKLLVRFHPATSSVSMTTNLAPCSENSANFYVAGMYPSTAYLMHWEEYSGTTLVNTGADLPFTTGAVPSTITLATFQVNVPATAHDAAYPVNAFFLNTVPFSPVATDLAGNVIWYAPAGVIRMEPGGDFYAESNTTLTKYDLAGNAVLQTNMEILDEQLAAKGFPAMSALNSHEVRNLPDGNIVVLAYRDVVSTSAQGGTPAKPVDIVGGMVLVLNHDLQLVWAWDAFAHQDIHRAATLKDTCTPGGGGCPPFNPAFAIANDWLHTNAAQGTADGNIVISERNQDWALKINYANGTGDGSLIWRMGAGGDFKITNPPAETCGATHNVFPWFTHQHDVAFQFEQDASASGFKIMTAFDDGNTRVAQCPAPQHSRGIVLFVNEAAREVYLETAADLGGYSFALGSGQLLTPGDGNVYASYGNGFLSAASEAQSTEVNLAGEIVYELQVNSSSYRTYRMQNLYTPTVPEYTASEIQSGTGAIGGVTAVEPFDFSQGFAQAPGALQLTGNASLAGNSLKLTDGGTSETSSVFYPSPVNVQAFTTDFTFQLTDAIADGFTFTIQNASAVALGHGGQGLGYEGIGKSVAIKFDTYANSGDPSGNSTGIFVDGALPVGGIDLTSTGIDLHSGDPMDAHFTYDGSTLTLSITDLTTSATWSHPFAINIPATVGGSSAYVGFTGASGEKGAVQQLLSWSYEALQVPINPTGFASGSDLVTNGSAKLAGTSLLLTDGGPAETSSAYLATPVSVQEFTTDFTFHLTDAVADGFTFTIQNEGTGAIGHGGKALGYGGIGKSVAIKFDLYANPGDPSNNSTGIFVGGALPVGGIDFTGSAINLHSGDTMDANLTYDGTTLTLTITDLLTFASWSDSFPIDIPAAVGSSTAYVGFTGASGGKTSTQQILTWTFE